MYVLIYILYKKPFSPWRFKPIKWPNSFFLWTEVTFWQHVFAVVVVTGDYGKLH